MRNYTDVVFACPSEESAEIVMAFLEDFPFESFDTTPREDDVVELHAYILTEEWKRCSDEAISSVADHCITIAEQQIEDENWNASWEAEGFERVDIDDCMTIRSPLHERPTNPNTIDIIVTPQMSFGSGHHHTTRMMCRMIYNTKCSGSVLDVGCGTGVLSIAALKCGATTADAVDIDPWSVKSANDAAELNGVTARMSVMLGTVEVIEGRCYDMLLANINRNIILNDISRYSAAIRIGGTLLVSGFLEGDTEVITATASNHDLRYVDQISEHEWVCIRFVKQ